MPLFHNKQRHSYLSKPVDLGHRSAKRHNSSRRTLKSKGYQRKEVDQSGTSKDEHWVLCCSLKAVFVEKIAQAKTCICRFSPLRRDRHASSYVSFGDRKNMKSRRTRFGQSVFQVCNEMIKFDGRWRLYMCGMPGV
jgi:hypothetical protein